MAFPSEYLVYIIRFEMPIMINIYLSDGLRWFPFEWINSSFMPPPL